MATSYTKSGNCSYSSSAKSGFSLLELLVVIALIAILVAGVGVAFRGGDSSNALTSAQSTIGAMFTSAQIQATTSGQNVYILLDTNPASEGFLRRFIIVRDVTANGTVKHQVVGKPILLPTGAYVSPPNGVGVSVATDAASNSAFIWLAGSDVERKLTSGGKVAATTGYNIQATLEPTSYRTNPNATSGWYGWKISPSGRIVDSSSSVNQIVLVTGTRMPNTLKSVKVDADDAYQTRGVKISYYGQVSMVDYYELFD